VAALLSEPALSFEDRLQILPHNFLEKQHHVVQEKVAALQGAHQRAADLDSLRQSLRDGLTDGRRVVTTSVEASLGAAQSLQGVVEAARVTVSSDVEKLGTEIDSQHTAQGREVETMRRDLETYEASFVERMDRVRQAVRHDADRLIDRARDRLDDLGSTLKSALDDLRNGLRELDDRVREAKDDGAEGRQSLAPYFEELENKLAPLKQTLENVREAAMTVGIPF
jgi:chromosome segregation ATPase